MKLILKIISIALLTFVGIKCTPDRYVVKYGPPPHRPGVDMVREGENRDSQSTDEYRRNNPSEQNNNSNNRN